MAHLLVGKYCDHLPIYRQSGIIARAGVHIPRDLLGKWTHKAIDLLTPISDAIRTEVLSKDYLQIDETPISYLVPGNGKTKKGYLWAANDPTGSVSYHWGVGRGVDQLVELIGHDFCGTAQTDGLSTYQSYDKSHPEATFTSCLAHIRRLFVETFEASLLPDKGGKGFDKQSAQIIGLIAELYRIEKNLREKQRAGPALREAVRQSQSRPIVHRLKKIIDLLIKRHRPSTGIGKALMYALGQWPRFERYLEDGRLEIDNNLVENCMRPLKLGMKNWLFFGSRNAGHHAATIYTLVENCKRHGVPVESYLREVLEVVPHLADPAKESVELTPAKIAAARRKDPRRANAS